MYVDGRHKVFKKISMCGSRDHGFAGASSLLLNIERHDLRGIPVKRSTKLIHDPILPTRLDQLSNPITILLPIAQLTITPQEQIGIVKANPTQQLQACIQIGADGLDNGLVWVDLDMVDVESFVSQLVS